VNTWRTPAPSRGQSVITALLMGLIEISEEVSVRVSWWAVLVLFLVVLGVWLYFRHPGVRAKRELRSAVERGNRARESMWQSTARTKAEMDRVAREYRRRR
jgi:UPF0716 family protein affecting phage T7 exclusion